MYERCEQTNNLAQAANMKSASALAGRACGEVLGSLAPRDRSPVDMQIDRKSRLNDELAVAVSELIADIRKIMRHDPRELVRPEEASAIKASPSCELESQLLMLNDSLEQQINLLRQVRGVLCL